MKIIVRLYTQNSGEILIGGKNIDTYTNSIPRRKVAYVNHEGFLFEGTILYNLTFSDNITLEPMIQKVCKICCIDEFINELPSKYLTFVNEGGISLSAGQRQRIVLARYLLNSPCILILDEALNNIDDEISKHILNNIRQFYENMTLILISHSETLLSNCNSVFYWPEN